MGNWWGCWAAVQAFGCTGERHSTVKEIQLEGRCPDRQLLLHEVWLWKGFLQSFAETDTVSVYLNCSQDNGLLSFCSDRICIIFCGQFISLKWTQSTFRHWQTLGYFFFTVKQQKTTPASLTLPLWLLFTPPLLHITSPLTGNEMPQLKVLRDVFSISISVLFPAVVKDVWFYPRRFGHTGKTIERICCVLPWTLCDVRLSLGISCSYAWGNAASMWSLKACSEGMLRTAFAHVCMYVCVWIKASEMDKRDPEDVFPQPSFPGKPASCFNVLFSYTVCMRGK